MAVLQVSQVRFHFFPQEQITTSDCLISLETTITTFWNILFCLSTSQSDSSCIGAEEITALKPNQKVNIIPGMRILFGRKDFSCQTMSDMRKIPCKFFFFLSISTVSALFINLIFLPYFLILNLQSRRKHHRQSDQHRSVDSSDA